MDLIYLNTNLNVNYLHLVVCEWKGYRNFGLGSTTEARGRRKGEEHGADSRRRHGTCVKENNLIGQRSCEKGTTRRQVRTLGLCTSPFFKFILVILFFLISLHRYSPSATKKMDHLHSYGSQSPGCTLLY
jgi:hypothetical protein